MPKTQAVSSDFLRDAAQRIAEAQDEDVLLAAEIIGLRVGPSSGSYRASGYGIAAMRSDGAAQAVRDWGRKAAERGSPDFAKALHGAYLDAVEKEGAGRG